MTELKILVCGDVCGNFRSLFSKVDAILNKKGAFEYLFCVGNFFGSHSDELEDLESGKIKVPLTTYVLGPNDVFHEKFYSYFDSVPNITYLGKKGCLTGISGLKIAYLSGVELSERKEMGKNDYGGSSTNDSIYFSKEDVSEMMNNLESEAVIDILLTSQWPKDITKYAISVLLKNSTPLLISWSKWNKETGIKTIPITDIPAKYPDVMTMDFYAFGLLKSTLSKHQPTTSHGVWKAFQGQNTNSDNTKGIICHGIYSIESSDVLMCFMGSLNKDLPFQLTFPIFLPSNTMLQFNCQATSASSFDNSMNSSYLISNLAKVLKPRYHFCGLAGPHYERVPYRNHEVMQEAPKNVTRFFALAPVNNTQKQKWLYAFNITPACLMSSKQLTAVPAVVTTCPYELKGSANMSNEQFFFDTTSPNTSRKRSQEDHPKHQSKKLSIDPSSCWFCFSNLDVERQLIISVGSHCYVTLAKGVLVPEHVLIVPIHHAISSVELSSDVSEEIEKFKKSLANYFHNENKDVVFFERNYSSAHLQVQVVPVPKQMKAEIQDALFTEARQYNLEFRELPNFCHIQQVLNPNKPFFYFELMVNNKTESKYLHIVKGKFPLQFGRAVLASPDVLNVMDRVEWKKCVDSKSVEKEMTEKMRKAFKPYDFTEQ